MRDADTVHQRVTLGLHDVQEVLESLFAQTQLENEKKRRVTLNLFE